MKVFQFHMFFTSEIACENHIRVNGPLKICDVVLQASHEELVIAEKSKTWTKIDCKTFIH